MTEIAEEVFYQAVLICSWIIVAFCFFAGLGLLLFPKATMRLNNALNRSFDSKGLEKVLTKQIEADQWIIGKRVMVGICALVVSIVFVLQLVIG